MKLREFSMVLANMLSVVLVLGCCGVGASQEVVNVYSARHYDTDDALYKKFTQQTGIEVRGK